MAAFKMQSNLLLAEIEEKNRVQCVQIEQQKDSKVGDQHEKGDASVDRTGFRWEPEYYEPFLLQHVHHPTICFKEVLV